MRARSLLLPGLVAATLIAACGGDDTLIAPKGKAGASGADGSQAGSAGSNAAGGSAGAGAMSGAGGGGTAGSGTAGNGTAGSGTAGNGTAGNGTAGSGTAGNGTAGSGTAGNGTAGNGTAGSGIGGTGNGTAGSGIGGTGNGTAGSGTAGNGAGGSPAPVCNPACSDGFQCVDGTCVLGSTCGREDIAVTRTPPNVLLSLDRSCSMTSKASNGVVKWTAAVGAMTTFTKTFDKQVRFGLELFPDTDDGEKCKMLDPLQVPVGANKGTAIGTLLTNALQKTDKYYPDGPCTTPIDWAVEKAEAEPALQDGKHPGFFVLITDGAQTSCGGTGDKGTTAAITNMKAKGIGTFVISFGTGTGIDKTQLNVWAEAGGYPNNADGDPLIQYYQASDEAGLNQALTTIAETAVSCDFALGKTPPDLDKLFVFEDLTDQVARDPKHTNGWDYDAAKNAVTLYGKHCTDLKKGVTKEVNVVYGCPGGGGSTELCASGTPKCDKDHLCQPQNGTNGLCIEGCCSYTKD